MKTNKEGLKLLRDKIGAFVNISDCKKALEECNGDVDKAVEKLRIIGLAKAGKKSDRMATDGLIAMHLGENNGILIELNCETDFVARNEKFMELAENLASLAHKERCINVDDLKNIKYENYATVHEYIMNESSIFGEKLELKRVCYMENKQGVIAGYVHGLTSSLGKTGALISIESSGDKIKLQEIGKQIAMHIVAMRPEALSINDLDSEKLHNERSSITAQIKSLNKPEEIANKIIEGRISKYYQEVVLLEQKFIKDDKLSISNFIKVNESNLSCSIKLLGYKLFTLGDLQ
ncbi:translation elongation factor Ts [Wolbachia pipientis]|uniref:Elongation factor Ts n=1 Tax=Wolbachia pipientis TaxID=955 RepID=A0A1E7QJW3_WOLPI|nr:translation elongation factor Ts [Wolbachia pipientis]OEY86758.1 translation elongation factor Ts [Wolbachia pipientis]